MSLHQICADKTISLTELKRGDTSFIDNLTEPVVILKRDCVMPYLIPVELMALVSSYIITKDNGNNK